jgi:two-component system sensor histidine kinase UhpB
MAWRGLLRIPFLYKILIVNSLIVALGAVVGTTVTVWYVNRFPEHLYYELIIFFAGAGLLISFLVNSWVLKRTLIPLDRLQEGVDAVRQGRQDVQVHCDGPSDERFDRLIETFNQMIVQQAEDAQRLHQLSHRILQAQEDERQRVARDLHDEAAQALTSLLVHLRLLERAYTPEQAQERVAELRQLTAQALEEVRRVALDLRPKILDDLGLVAALGWRVDEMNADGEIRAILRVEGIHGRLPRTLELVLYRVAQEALNNVARHSRATQLLVHLSQQGETLRLEVADNGQGFDPQGLAEGRSMGRGLGLMGMSERLSMVHGSIDWISAPGQGTQMVAEVPLPQSQTL